MKFSELPSHGMLSIVIAALFQMPAPAADVEIRTDAFAADVTRGALVSLIDSAGTRFVRPCDGSAAARVEWVGAGQAAPAIGAGQRIQAGGSASVPYAPVGTGALTCAFSVEAATGDLVVRQAAARCGPGVWGVSWSIGEIPAECAIVVPAGSGLRLDAHSPGVRHVFDYPVGWEAQLVIVEGAQRGFYVFADDPQGRFKRLTATRTPGGWRLDLATINDAPFDAQTACESVAWRLHTYQGDWRVPARRYRDWMQANLQPVPLAAKSPDWVREIRACAIVGMSLTLLDELAQRLDPPQTLLYVPDWRQAGYDRNYPDYASPRPELGPFLDRAHAWGFRVMLHVNYFGVDPLHPLYRDFERFHVRSPWGEHPRQWWEWDRAEPPIKFAYINPAAAAWRRHFVGAMTDLCRRFAVDALHLDQTLCIDNDHNGRLDGLSMIQGNVALHAELRAALPEVALSGEGLNEVTCRHEAFAQRHVWGLNHADGTWSEAWLRCAHPVSSYLFLPYTTLYGYLGIASPDQGQLYAAWNEAYEHFGVIPTLKPAPDGLAADHGFQRQFLDEAACWQRARLGPDLDGEWSADTAFPFRAADGGPAVRQTDGRFVAGGRTISHTVRGVNSVEAAGMMAPGWAAHGAGRIFGLDPEKRYALLPGVADPHVFHVCDLPEGLVIESAFADSALACVRTRAVCTRVADLAPRIGEAVCGWRLPSGEAFEAPGSLDAANGAACSAVDDGLFAHPPYRDGAAGGEAFARFTLSLPREGRLRLACGVALRRGAVGKERSDGVTFRAAARAGQTRLERSVPCAAEEPLPLELDLTPLAGQEVELELAVHPGPAGNPSFDWARWVAPRVEVEATARGGFAVAGAQRWACALGVGGALPLAAEADRLVLSAELPGPVFLLASPPAPVHLPADLLPRPQAVSVLVDGLRPAAGRIAGVQRTTRVSGGVGRPAFLAHPPQQGTTAIHLPLRLPPTPARFAAQVGLADGSKSTGVVFVVEANGRQIARQRMVPGGWQAIAGDLAPWAGQDLVLSLITDSDGGYDYDWALWAEPRLEASPRFEAEHPRQLRGR